MRELLHAHLEQSERSCILDKTKKDFSPWARNDNCEKGFSKTDSLSHFFVDGNELEQRL
jgi:hypothetical protein